MSGLYNMVNGYNLACLWIMPLLGRHEDEYPRFRDCYLEEKNGEYLIVIYTRVGGGNRNCGYGEEELYKDPLFVETVDDDFDKTYAEYKFRVPEKWKDDFNKILEGDFANTSNEYKKLIKSFYPKLTNKLEQVFNSKKENAEKA